MRSRQDEIELCVLGAMLINNNNSSSFLAVPIEAFTNEAHRWTAIAMRLLLSRCHPVDLVSVKDELTSMDILGHVGGAAFVAALTDGVPRANDISWHVRELMISYGRRLNPSRLENQ